VSEDGNGFLSDLHWTTWTATKAVAAGSRYVRCSNIPGEHDPGCTRVLQGYNVPATVLLTKP
jgi:hypothetical protein